MNSMKWIGRSVVAAAMLCVLPLAGADDANHTSDEPLIARTIPSHTVKPSFMEVGIVKEWLVKPDDVVKKGQELGREDTDLDDMQLKAMQVEANSDAEIKAKEAARDARKVEYENKEKGEASEQEILDAKLQYQTAEAELAFAHTEKDKKLADVQVEARKIEKMHLLSPVDGTVKEISIQEGEIVDPNKPNGALTVVTNNPLWVEVKIPSVQALKLKQGDTTSVAYQNEPDKWMNATIIFLDPEVDAASDKQTARLELNNDQNRPAGLWVNVRLSLDGGAH